MDGDEQVTVCVGSGGSFHAESEWQETNRAPLLCAFELGIPKTDQSGERREQPS